MNLNQKLHAWFFTNEALANFLSRLPETDKIKKIFGIAGSGDFAFNFLSQNLGVKKVILCDNRLAACLTVRLKRLFFKTLSRSEVLNLLFNKNFLKKFKRARIWYPDSFCSKASLVEYAPYLLSGEKFFCLQNNLSKIEIIPGDFLAVLKQFPDDYFDLIYVSNIFDAKSYFSPTNEETQLIKNKLSSGGRLLVVAQDMQKDMIKKIMIVGFVLQASEIHRFNLWYSFWRYDFSFLLFEKTKSPQPRV